MSYPNRGGRIAPDNRPAAAKGVGKRSKRHDLERRNVPFLHGSDLQQGDVKAMEAGQRVGPKQTQNPAASAPIRGSNSSGVGANATGVPDPITFLGGRSTGQFNPGPIGSLPYSSNAATWLPILRQLAISPGSSGLLAGALIQQARMLSQVPRRDSAVIDMRAVDDSIEAMLGNDI